MKKLITNTQVLVENLGYDSDNLEFERVINDIQNIDIEYGVEVIFKYYRKYGFPYPKIREDEKHTHMRKLQKFDVDSIFIDNEIIQTMHCLRLAWTYFPHWVNIKCGSSKMPPIDYFNDDKKLKGIIRKTWIWQMNYGRDRFTENRIRQCLKLYQGSQGVSNFRPTAAKLIYEKFGGDGVIWDMSCGWGGRLIGFLASSRKHYIGTEPSSKTYDGLLKIKEDFEYLGKKVEIHKLGSEVFQPDKESLDLCFTSPPYFDTEKYSDESTQSYVKFPTKEEWIDGFLRKTIENCYSGLKSNKYMLINIANTPKYKFIEEQTVKISKELGFKQEQTVELTLSSVMGAGYKYEPIFVFKK